MRKLSDEQRKVSVERKKEYQRNWCKNNPEKRAASIKRYQQKNWEKHLQWAKDHPGEVNRHKKKHNLQKRYGLTLEQWEIMLLSQSGKCSICKDREATDVDHDHKTGKIRSLLCNPCNMMLGAIRDNPKTLREGARYLERHL